VAVAVARVSGAPFSCPTVGVRGCLRCCKPESMFNEASNLKLVLALGLSGLGLGCCVLCFVNSKKLVEIV
jgi:hypothetical protein